MSIYRIPNQPPVTWFRYGKFGEGGTWGAQMDASGLETRNRVVYKELIPAIPNITYLVRLRVLSTLVASSNGFEGLATRLTGFVIDGDEPDDLVDRQVWDSNPDQGGKKRWFARQTQGYETVAFTIENVPKGVDYVKVELVTRAVSGQVWLDGIETRHLFQQTSEWRREGFTDLFDETLFNYEEIPVIKRDGIDQSTNRQSAYLNYLTDPEPFYITRGQYIEVEGSPWMWGRVWQDGVGRIESEMTCYIRFKVAGEVRYHMASLASQTSTSPLLSRQQMSLREQALANYESYQLVAGFSVVDETFNIADGKPGMAWNLIDFAMRSLDFVRPSQ